MIQPVNLQVRAAEVDEKKGERPCRSCKTELSAVAFCRTVSHSSLSIFSDLRVSLQCATDLCNNCVQAHRDMRMFDGHEVTFSFHDHPLMILFRF